MNSKDKWILEQYAHILFGCSYDDLSETEEQRLIEYVYEHNPDFGNHRGLFG